MSSGKNERLLTPVGEARWAHVQVPKPAYVDPKTGQPKGEPHFQIEVVFDPKDTTWQPFCKDIKARVEAVKGKNLPIKWETTKGDKGEKVKTGLLSVTFKTSAKFKPSLFDKFGRPLAEGTLVGNGSKVRVNYSPSAYEGLGGGVSLYLNAVQVIDLVVYASKKAEDYGFDVSEPPPDDPFPPDATPGGPSDARGVPIAGVQEATGGFDPNDIPVTDADTEVVDGNDEGLPF